MCADGSRRPEARRTRRFYIISADRTGGRAGVIRVVVDGEQSSSIMYTPWRLENNGENVFSRRITPLIYVIRLARARVNFTAAAAKLIDD